MKANKELLSIVREYDDCLKITDFNIVYQGAIIDYISIDENNDVHFFAGDPTTKYFDELIIDNNTARLYVEEIIDNF